MNTKGTNGSAKKRKTTEAGAGKSRRRVIKKADRKASVQLAVFIAVLIFILSLGLLMLPKSMVSEGAVRESPEELAGKAESTGADPYETNSYETVPYISDLNEIDSYDTVREDDFSLVAVKKIPETEPRKPAVVKGRIAIVIDDVGYNSFELEPFLKIPVPMTFAVLPNLEYTSKTALMISQAGKEVILHQPVEPLGKEDPGEGAIYVGMEAEEIKKIVSENIRQIPGIVGVNNHMGSKGTADREVVSALLEVVTGKGLFFLDSKTTDRSVVPILAAEMGIPILERSIFLDNEREQQAIREALDGGLRIAERDGRAVMIGHVWTRELAELLMEIYPTLLEDGYTFENLSGLLLGKDVE